MNSLIENFLNQDDENIKLYIKFKNYSDKDALAKLEKRFDTYVFNLNFCSYISKSMKFYSKHYKERNLKKEFKEILNLNLKDESFGEERINMISDTEVNFIEELTKPKKDVDFKRIIEDYKLINAIDQLTQKQKEVLYKSIVLQMKEKELVEELGISRQAINKHKRLALKKLKNELKKSN